MDFRYPAAGVGSVASLEVGGSERDSPDGPPLVLDDVTFTVEPGQTVALVGPSGAGKSTIASLIPRLYDVTGGSLRVDGHDVRSLAGQPARHHRRRGPGPAPVPRHRRRQPPLRPSDGHGPELREACLAAQVLDVIDALPQGLDTMVGERGYRLSGGEKQRLAIARMLLKDPAVVVLDEATSSLDSENEAAIQAALSIALEGRTAIVIAHRLSTITGADRIVVVDGGRVVETGRHDELLDDGGLYADLYRTLVGSTFAWNDRGGTGRGLSRGGAAREPRA